MNREAGRGIFNLYLVAAVAAVLTVLMTRFGGWPGLLEQMTVEGGPFETATALALAALGLWCLLRRTWYWRIFGLLLILAALEEISWGQRLLGFETPLWLKGANYQEETNLHNLIDSEVFSALVLVPVHIAFVYLPLMMRLWPRLGELPLIDRIPPRLMPSPHTTLIFCFGWGLHAWWMPAAAADSAALLIALALAGFACWRGGAWRAPGVRLHYGLVCLATLIFAMSASIYRYYNMQYEIRELFVVIGFAHWLTAWAGTGRFIRLERSEVV